jgi:hypothetical protein
MARSRDRSLRLLVNFRRKPPYAYSPGIAFTLATTPTQYRFTGIYPEGTPFSSGLILRNTVSS